MVVWKLRNLGGIRDAIGDLWSFWKDLISLWRSLWKDYYMRRTLLFFIPYFIFNLLDLITTEIALSSGTLIEMNPFYSMLPFAEMLKIISPFVLLSVCVFLYLRSSTEKSREMVGRSSVRCMFAISLFFALVTVNNLYWLSFCC